MKKVQPRQIATKRPFELWKARRILSCTRWTAGPLKSPVNPEYRGWEGTFEKCPDRQRVGNPNAARAWPMAVSAIKARKAEFATTALKAIYEIQGTGVNTLAKIASCMNKRGEKTARGGTWTATAVKRVLACA